MTASSDQFKGRAKEAVGRALDDPDLEREGRADVAGGKVKRAVGDAKEHLDHAVDAVKGKLTKHDD